MGEGMGGGKGVGMGLGVRASMGRSYSADRGIDMRPGWRHGCRWEELKMQACVHAWMEACIEASVVPSPTTHLPPMPQPTYP